MSVTSRVAVFCGSSNSVDEHYLDLATELGQQLAQRRVGVVYGGGATGLMGAVARGAMACGGEVIGVIPSDLFTNGIDGSEITRLEAVADMHERKSRMYTLADAFIGLPGGMGTFEEIFEAATWSQLGLHAEGRRKPVVLLAADDYWAPVHALLDQAADRGFMRSDTRAIVSGAAQIDEAIDLIIATG